MLNNEKTKVKIITYNKGVDSYGQLRQLGQSEREVEMTIKIFSQSNISDPRYIQVTDVGLTLDNQITPDDSVLYNGDIYNILYVIPTRRYNQILMRKK